MHAVTKDHLRSYRDAIRRLPANAGARKDLAGKTLPELIASGEPAGLSDRTVHLYINRAVGGFFRWAVRMDYIEKSPTDGVMAKPKSKPRDERDAFDDSDLGLIFGADFRELRAGERPEDYWLPLLMLHTGARNEEVAQLLVRDVEALEGVPCIRIRADAETGQRLKTATSKRTIPVHPTLVALGFLDFVDQQRDRGEGAQLFAGLRRSSNGFHSATSRRFNRRLSQLGIGGKKSAYSFRHTFATRLRDAGVPAETISELMGHAQETMTMSRYVKAPSPRLLLEAVSRFSIASVQALVPKDR